MTVIATKIPALRFPEFEGEWEEKRLREIGEFIGGGTPSTGKTRYWGGTIPWISSSDLSEDSIHEIKVTRFISSEAISESATKLVPKNSILIISRVGVGKIAVNERELCTSQDFTNLNLSRDNYIFIAYMLKRRVLKLLGFNQGTSIKGFLKSDLEELLIDLPPLHEQQKIAAFLITIDTRIQQLSRKKTLLEQYKKGVMQQIFSQEIRFKDEEGKEFPAWEEKRLGEFLIKHDEKSTKNNQYPVLTSSLRGIFFQKDYFAGEDVASEDNTGYNVVPRGYFTYRHMSDTVIFKFNINTLADKGIVSTLYPVFTTKEINDYFLKTILNEGEEFKRYSLEQKQGGSRTYMYFSKLENCKLTLPSLLEQQKIADFLSTIDRQINLASQQLNRMQTFKKGLLQQLFV